MLTPKNMMCCLLMLNIYTSKLHNEGACLVKRVCKEDYIIKTISIINSMNDIISDIQ